MVSRTYILEEEIMFRRAAAISLAVAALVMLVALASCERELGMFGHCDAVCGSDAGSLGDCYAHTIVYGP